MNNAGNRQTETFSTPGSFTYKRVMIKTEKPSVFARLVNTTTNLPYTTKIAWNETLASAFRLACFHVTAEPLLLSDSGLLRHRSDPADVVSVPEVSVSVVCLHRTLRAVSPKPTYLHHAHRHSHPYTLLQSQFPSLVKPVHPMRRRHPNMGHSAPKEQGLSLLHHGCHGSRAGTIRPAISMWWPLCDASDLPLRRW